ncbi:MAG: C2H2-type zinc finger protein [Candidatus Nitrosocaldaceae archaeon]
MIKKRHSVEYILTIIAGIIMLVNSIPFIASLFIQLPSDIIFDRFRLELGEEGFRLAQIRIITSSLLSGIMLIVLATMMERHPRDLRHYGIMTIIVSVVSLVGMGLIHVVSIIITLIGIAGGSIAIIRGREGVIMIDATYKPIEHAEYFCSKCNIMFSSDNELRKHMVKHIEYD